MGGLEPPSKQRIQKLSTRLVYIWFSGKRLPADRPSVPYLLKSCYKAGASLQPALCKWYPVCREPKGV